MVDISALIEQFRSILPAQIQEFWWLVLVIAGLVLLLILVNLPKLFKKKNAAQIQTFKSENQPPLPTSLPSLGALPSKFPQAKPMSQPATSNSMRPGALLGQANPVNVHHAAMIQHNVQQPHKDYKQLEQFVRAQLDANFSVNLIRNNLLAVGWDKNVVDQTITKVSKQIEEAGKI